MSESEKHSAQRTQETAGAEQANPQSDAAAAAHQRRKERQEARRWWIKLFIQPVLLLACGALLIAGLGLAQRLGFISAGSGGQSHASSAGEAVRYICPMMCTPPQSEPGRCPVCAMELVPATSAGGDADSRSVQIEPAARRIANIHTVAVKSMPITRTIRAVGELHYDEGKLKTISAYVDGRIERLYANYTGVDVDKGDHLALLYSPRLYSGQVEYLLAKKAGEDSRSTTRARLIGSSPDLEESARQRLTELGMTDAQIEQLEETGRANSRLRLCAPISGTVIERLAVEGEYVKEGQPIYKLADLSTVWLILELFPEDAATIRYGQQVEADVQSLPGRKFTGRVAFIDPNVDPKTRTVGVRVVIPSEDRVLRVGDYAKAAIRTPVTGLTEQHGEIYDPELADKWISPRHPHVVKSSPGKCPICSVELVPAAQFGFTAAPSAGADALVVPRNAVLMAGENSVVYVETEPGRFEIRRVTLGPSCGGQIVILDGVTEGEQVAARGNFLIDSQMQLAGNPSLIDPTKAEPWADETVSPEMIAALSELSPEDRRLADSQRICPVADYLLGAMGKPIKVDVMGTPVFICCEGCRNSLLDEPEKYLAKLGASDSSQESRDAAMMDVPPIDTPKMLDAQSGLPPIEAPRAIMEESTEGRQTHDEQAAPVAELSREVVE